MIATLASNSKALWYLTRGTGVVTLLLLTASVVLGILQVTRWSSARWPRFVTAGLHKNLSLLVVVFLFVHVATAVFDSFAPIRWLDAVLPFTGAYRPIWLGFGALACDMLIALIVTSLLRVRLGYPAWRAIHWLAYACWPVALIHGLGTGSDTRHPWALGLEAISVALVAGATWWRIGQSVTVPVGRRLVAASGVAAAILATSVWTFVGPLQHAWARRSGTPTHLLASARRTDATTPPPTDARPAEAPTTGTATLKVPFAARIAGTLSQTAPDQNGETIVVIDAQLHHGASGHVHVVIQGQALNDGGVTLERSRAYLGTGGTPALYAGTIQDLQGTRIVARLADAGGHRVELTLDINLDQSGNRLTGDANASTIGQENG